LRHRHLINLIFAPHRDHGNETGEQ
jgi:hypothetical protein